MDTPNLIGGAWTSAARGGRRIWAAMVGPEGWRSVMIPACYLVLAIVLLIYNHTQQHVNDLVFWLGLALIVSIFARIIESNRRQSQAVKAARRKTLRDPVSGLANRMQLQADLAAALGRDGERWILSLVELEGLGSYYNRFGSESGDRLLRDLAERLTERVGGMGSSPYQLDSSRFALLVPAGELQLGEIVAKVVSEVTAPASERHGEILLASAHGEATVPDDAAEVGRAFQIAGQRLAASQQRQRRSAKRQAHAVLVEALNAWQPELRDRMRLLAPRVIAIGRRFNLGTEQLDDLMLAASLHDTGMVTLPDSLMEKAAPPDGHERELINSHPLAGERIIGAAPALAPVARIVRSAYERFDGSGYPDGLSGTGIPIEARIISACVAFAAMTSPRPYRPASGVREAVAELRRCAGTQFDPRVVEALATDLAEDGAGWREGAEPATPPPVRQTALA